MRTMYDSVTPTDIPASVDGRPPELVAGYIDGVPRWPDAAWARFPDSIHVRIALDPVTNDGHVLDVERGAANPDQAPGWVQRRRAAGTDPTVYCNAATWPAVRAAFAAAGVAEPHYWIAAYPGWTDNQGNPVVPAGAVAHQYKDPPTTGGHWDLSVVADHWPGVDTNRPNTTVEDEMGFWVKMTQGPNESSGYFEAASGDLLILPLPDSVRAANAFSDLNGGGASDAEALGRWNALAGRWDRNKTALAQSLADALKADGGSSTGGSPAPAGAYDFAGTITPKTA